MLQANISAATQITDNLPEQALLRRHEPPSERRIAAYVAYADRYWVGPELLQLTHVKSNTDHLPQVGATICFKRPELEAKSGLKPTIHVHGTVKQSADLSRHAPDKDQRELAFDAPGSCCASWIGRAARAIG
jgi:hypothetical protein